MSNRTQIARKSKPKPNDGLTRKQRATQRLLLQPWPTKVVDWSSVGRGKLASLYTHKMVYDKNGEFLRRQPLPPPEAL